MYNLSSARVTITTETGAPIANALVSGRFLDDYWTNNAVTGTTNASGIVSWSFKGPCGVGAIAFLVEKAALDTQLRPYPGNARQLRDSEHNDQAGGCVRPVYAPKMPSTSNACMPKESAPDVKEPDERAALAGREDRQAEHRRTTTRLTASRIGDTSPTSPGRTSLTPTSSPRSLIRTPPYHCGCRSSRRSMRWQWMPCFVARDRRRSRRAGALSRAPTSPAKDIQYP